MVEFPSTIVAKQCVLRKIRLLDALAWKNCNNAIAKKTSWPIVPSIVYAKNEILSYLDSWNKGEEYVYVILLSGKVVGDVHVSCFTNKSAEFGIALHPKTWGTGIVYDVLAAIKQVAKRKKIVLWGRTEEENIRSWKALEKFGATFKGRKVFMIDKQQKNMRVYEL